MNEVTNAEVVDALKSLIDADRKTLAAVVWLDQMIKRATKLAGADNPVFLMSAGVADVLLTATENAQLEHGETDTQKAVMLLLAAAMRLSAGSIEVMRRRVNPSKEDSNDITV